jgi:Lrp/AsnC family transcriptional regulator, leucine-responsive regulatory protein
MLDQTDLRILALLRENARLSWKKIGEQVHLTGQAVGNRIRRMEDMGVIRGYTAVVDPAKLGPSLTAIVTILMKTTDHGRFERFVSRRPEIVEAHRVSGEGCYSLLVRVPDQTALNALLDAILAYGNYRLSLSIGRLKKARPSQQPIISEPTNHPHGDGDIDRVRPEPFQLGTGNALRELLPVALFRPTGLQ